MTNNDQHYRVSKHAIDRMQQRGLSETDVAAVRRFGDYMADGYVMTAGALNNYRSSLKKELQRLDRLAGVVVIEQDQTIVTVYRAKKSKIRNLKTHN